jgi:Mg2+-importing ATPase
MQTEGHRFSATPVEQLFVQLHSSSTGLTDAEAEERAKSLFKFFKSEIRFKRELKLLIRQFTNPLVLLLVVAVVLSNMFSVTGASLFLPFLPMLPKQILLTNLITDLPFLTIASDHVEQEQLVRPG